MKHKMDQRLLLIAILVNFNFFISAQNSAERLYSDLLQSYQKGVRPGIESNCSLNVNISLTVRSLLNINNVEETMAVTGFLTMFWRDERLKWNVTRYDGLSSLLIDPSLLWTPRVVLINPAKRFQMFGIFSTEVRVNSDGFMVWSAGDVMETNCKINIRNYPFDIQICDISIAPWGYLESEVNQTTFFSTQYQDFPLGNGEWDLVKRSNVDWVSEGYKASNFTLHYKRKYQFVLINIIAPIVVLNVINMVVFRIPPNSGERISFSVTVLLSYVVFLTIVMDNVPTTSSPVSLLSVYLIVRMIMSACVTMETVFIVQVSDRPPSIPISDWIVYLVHKSRKIEPQEQTWAEPVENVLERVKSPKKQSRNASIESNDNICSNFQRQKQFLYFTIVLGVVFTTANYMMIQRAAAGAYVIGVNLPKELASVDRGESIPSVRHERSMENRPNITSVLEMMNEDLRTYGKKDTEMEEVKVSFPTKSSYGVRRSGNQHRQERESDETLFENNPELTTISTTTKYVSINTNPSPVSDIQAEREGHRLLIVAYFRSGSTFTADIFKNYSDIFYVFEPLHALDYNIKRKTPVFYLNGSSRLNHAANMSNMNFLHNEAKKWLYCRFDELDTSSLTDALTWRFGGEIGKTFLLCNGVKRLMPLVVKPKDSHRKCNNLVRDSCLGSNLRLFKFIRLPMTVAGRLLTGDSNLKVIHLLRDPRGMLMSQRRKEYNIEWPIRYCETMLSDLKASVQLQNIFPGRVTILRYEDLAENPVSIARKLYKFAGIPMSKTIEEHIKEKTSGGKEKSCMLCTQKANSSATASKWRTKIDLRYMKLIDHACEKFYEAAGYVEFKRKADLLNLSLPSKDQRDYILK